MMENPLYQLVLELEMSRLVLEQVLVLAQHRNHHQHLHHHLRGDQDHHLPRTKQVMDGCKQVFLPQVFNKKLKKKL